MCDALLEIMKDELDEREQKGRQEGRQEGENLFAQLTEKLLSEDRIDDLQRATSDEDFRSKLYNELV